MQHVDARVLRTWGTLVRDARQAAGLSQGLLARKLKVAQATVQRWEAGATVPSDELHARLVDLLGPTVDVQLVEP